MSSLADSCPVTHSFNDPARLCWQSSETLAVGGVRHGGSADLFQGRCTIEPGGASEANGSATIVSRARPPAPASAASAAAQRRHPLAIGHVLRDLEQPASKLGCAASGPP